MNYSIITPARNESVFIEETIKSVVSQVVVPVEWIIMDDDSTDDTYQTILKYLSDYPFIKYVKLTEFRKDLVNTGGRVAAIINYADSLRTKKTDIIAKIDADTRFEKDFFANIINEYEKDPCLGIASGHLVENDMPEKIIMRTAVRGAALISRYECFTQIGKLYESNTRGEDVLACVAARALGWKTCTFDYYFHHLKPEGSRKSKLKNHYETGYYKGSIPYFAPFFLGTLLRDIFKKPFFLGALVQFYSYCLSRFIKKYRPYPDFVSRQLNREQKAIIRKILFSC